MTESELRAHPRVFAQGGVELRSAAGRVACLARDLSLAGCYLEAKGALQGEPVEVLFRIPGKAERIACPARVVRRDVGRNGFTGFAVRFLSVDWEALVGLARLVSPRLG